MKKLLVTVLMAVGLVTVAPGSVEALPYNCSMSPNYSNNPDTAFGWCLNGWSPGDRAQLRLTCRNSNGATTTSGHSANVIWNANQVSSDKCPKSHPIIYTWTVARWNIA